MFYLLIVLAAIVVGCLVYLKWKRPHSTRLGRAPAAAGTESPIAGWAARMFKKKWVWIPLVILAIWVLTPNVYWLKFTGWDPSTLWATETEDAIYNYKKKKERLADKARADLINAATTKLSRGEKLTPEEERALLEAARSPAAAAPSVQALTLATRPQAEWRQFQLSPQGRSELIPRPSGMHFKVACSGQCSAVSVYVGKPDCSSPESNCPTGSAGIYVLNRTSGQNVASVALEAD